MTYDALIAQARESIITALDTLCIKNVDFVVEPSARTGFGDVSCNVAFLAAKTLKKPPRDIATDIASACKPSSLVASIKAHPTGHINFIANTTTLCESVISASLKSPVCKVNVGNGSMVVLEHTSVNPNKALHIGHMRNVILGDVISRLLVATNHKVRVLNYVDDLGLQVASLVMGFTQFGYSESPPEGKRFDQYCGDVVYVDAAKRIIENSKLKAQTNEILAAMETDNTDDAKIARRVSTKILAHQLDTCWRIGAYYDCLNFESHIIHSGMWKEIFTKLQNASMIRLETKGDNVGCWIVPGIDEKHDKVLVRSSGTATYIAKDIPYAAWKLGLVTDPFRYTAYSKEQPHKLLMQTSLVDSDTPSSNIVVDRVITVIDSRQTLLQNIITGLLIKFFDIKKEKYLHLAYESVALSVKTADQLGKQTDGKNVQMSGRTGMYISADLVLDMLYERAQSETSKRNSDMDSNELAKISREISVGALRYEMIKQDLDKMITFDLDRSLRLDGDTSSYIQYSYARATRILEKVGNMDAVANYAALSDIHELDLVRAIGTLDITIRDASINLSPKVIARFAHNLTVTFNSFYEHVRVVDASQDDSVTAARVNLVKSFKAVLAYVLDILGIPLPSRM